MSCVLNDSPIDEDVLKDCSEEDWNEVILLFQGRGDDCGVRRNGTCVESFATPLPVLFDWYGNADVVEQQVNEMREVTFAYTKRGCGRM